MDTKNNECRPGSVCARSARGLGGCGAGECEQAGTSGVNAVHHPGTSCRARNQNGMCGCKDLCAQGHKLNAAHGVMASEVRPGQPSMDERLREHAAANVAAAQLALDEAIATQRDVSGVMEPHPPSRCCACAECCAYFKGEPCTRGVGGTFNDQGEKR